MEMMNVGKMRELLNLSFFLEKGEGEVLISKIKPSCITISDRESIICCCLMDRRKQKLMTS